MVDTLRILEKRKVKKYITVLVLVLFLCGCSLYSADEEVEEDPFVNWQWMGMMLELHVIEKWIERDDSGDYVRELQGEGAENDYIRERQEEDYLILTSVGALVEEGGGVVVNFDDSEWKIGEEYDYSFIDVTGPARRSSWLRDIDWCGEEINASSFTSEWMDDFGGKYSTEEEYLESIEDYVNCGSGYI